MVARCLREVQLRYVDTGAVDAEAPVVTDVETDSFCGLRRFLVDAVAAGLESPVKWQFVGPVTLGVALTRAGLDDDVAFAVAARAVRSHVVSLSAAVAAALPRCPQIVVIDEPWFADLSSPGFPVDPDTAIDLLSGAMASVAGGGRVNMLPNPPPKSGAGRRGYDIVSLGRVPPAVIRRGRPVNV